MRGCTALWMVLVVLALPGTGEAIPSFARQMGASCNLCHAENGFPVLTPYGRTFKASGYTLPGSQTLIQEGEDFLSLPSALNLALVVKYRIRKRGSNAPVLNFPDEWVLFAGGRIGKHVGFVAEAAAEGASVRIPLTFQVNPVTVGIVPFTTDALGVAFSYELFSTGAVKNLRPLEHGAEISAPLYVGTNTPSTGVGVYVHHEKGGVAVAGWWPMWGPDMVDFGVKSPALYARAYLTPLMPETDLALGVQLWGGEARWMENGTEVKEKPRAIAADAQWMGQVADRPVMAGLSFATVDTSSDLHPGGTENVQALAGFVEAGLVPAHLSVLLGFRQAKTGAGDGDNAVTLGAKVFLHRNVQLQLAFSQYLNETLHPDKNLLTLMLFMGI